MSWWQMFLFSWHYIWYWHVNIMNKIYHALSKDHCLRKRTKVLQQEWKNMAKLKKGTPDRNLVNTFAVGFCVFWRILMKLSGRTRLHPTRRSNRSNWQFSPFLTPFWQKNWAQKRENGKTSIFIRFGWKLVWGIVLGPRKDQWGQIGKYPII